MLIIYIGENGIIFIKETVLHYFSVMSIHRYASVVQAQLVLANFYKHYPLLGKEQKKNSLLETHLKYVTGNK